MIAVVGIRMKGWESLIDKKIREAIEQGEFDDLSGKGRPIDLSENPFEDPDWRLAHRMLRNAGFAPAWIEERKDIDNDLEAARTIMARAWLVKKNARGEHSRSAEARWRKALADFREKATELNRRIDLWNLKAPDVGFHRKRIAIDQEIQRIQLKKETAVLYSVRAKTSMSFRADTKLPLPMSPVPASR